MCAGYGLHHCFWAFGLEGHKIRQRFKRPAVMNENGGQARQADMGVLQIGQRIFGKGGVMRRNFERIE